MLVHAELTNQIIGAAITVHDSLGPGLLESTYEACLAQELASRGCNVRRQEMLPVFYRGIRIDAGYRIDLLVDDQVIVELKAVDRVLPIHESQLLTYLRLTTEQVGLLINFNVLRLHEGVIRRVLTHREA
jgi:GxxExxY protein